MNIHSLRRAALVVASVAFLASRASAQSDATFASTLGKMPAGLATMAQLKTEPQKPPQAQGPTAPADVWRKVFSTVLRTGTHEAIPDSPLISYTTVDQFTTPRGRVVKYAATFLVMPAENGKVRAVAAMFTMTQISWIPAKNIWLVDLRVYETDGGGRVKRAYNVTDTVVSETEKTEGAPEEMDLADPATKDEFELTLDWWFKS
jgi:hypothetical protein